MRFGVIGTNFISKEFVSAGLGVEGFAFAAVCSRREETGRAFADSFGGGAVCFTTPEALAAWDGADAVYIATPNRYHKEQAELMLRHGKHVLLEKPACPDAEGFASLRRTAREHGVVLLEAMRPVFTPGFIALKQALPMAGALRQASLSYCQYSSRYDAFKAGEVKNAFDPSLCNGALMDIGIYCAHALIALFGSPERVLALATRLPNGLDAQVDVLCGYGDMLAELSCSKVSDGRRQNEIQGEAGTLTADSITNPKRVEFIRRGGGRELIYEDPDPEFFGMRHEIAAFLSFAAEAECPARSWEAYNEATEQTLRLTDEIRRQTGIDFKTWGSGPMPEGGCPANPETVLRTEEDGS